MTFSRLAHLALGFGALALPAAAGSRAPLARLAAVPLAFEPNQGQAGPGFQFLTRTPGYSMYLNPAEAVMVLASPVRSQEAVVRMRLAGADRAARAIPREPQSGVSAYFLGGDPSAWRRAVPHFSRVEYRGVYPGVDLVYYGDQQQVEYDFVVAPGADPRRIRLEYSGVRGLSLTAEGDLALSTRLGDLKQLRPRVWQEIDGRRVPVDARYRVNGRQVRFEVAAYDRSRPLVIDPVLAYSSVLGSILTQASSIAVDSAGAVYVAGGTQDPDFPTLNGYPIDHSYVSAFVMKFHPNAGDGPLTLAYSTLLGGSASDGTTSPRFDGAVKVAVDPAGAAYLTGITQSTDFPLVNPAQAVHAGGPDCAIPGCREAFVAKIDAYSGSGPVTLGYSTYLGGTDNDYPGGIAVDSAGAAYVTGRTYSPDFPLLHAYQTDPPHALSAGGITSHTTHVFITKYNPHPGSGPVTLAYSSYFGGLDADAARAIAVDASGAAYIAGVTSTQAVSDAGLTSTEFPLLNSFKGFTIDGYSEAFVTKFNPHDGAGNLTLAWSSIVGGSLWDFASAIAVDSVGAVYVGGATSSLDFPLRNAFQTANGTTGLNNTGFFIKMVGGADLPYSTHLGGTTDDQVLGVAVDDAHHAYLTGYTKSTDFPVRNGAANTTYQDAFLAKIDPNQSGDASLLYSTCFGGYAEETSSAIALGPDNAVYLAGQVRRESSAPYFPRVNAYSSAHSGDAGFVVRYNQAVLSLSKTHTGSFAQRQQNAEYTLTVSNAADAAGSTKGAVTVTENPPAGLGLAGMGGSGWDCAGASCTRSDALAPGASYPPITVLVDVAADASSPQVNQATVGGGGSASATASDSTVITVVSDAATTTVASNAAVTYSPAAQTVTLSATVSSTSPVNSGTVSFTLLGTTVSAAVSAGAASTVFTVPAATPADAYGIQAVYNPGPGFAASSDATHQLTIAPATPVIVWPNPADITFGTALGPAQLNASASVPGAFVYTPAAGAVLPVGAAQTLSAAFTPSDAINYTTASATAFINVLAAPASTPARIVVTRTLSRNAGNVVVRLTLTNTGGTAAQNLRLTAGRIQTTSGAPLPQSLGSLAAGASATAVLTFPGSVGAAGSAAALTVAGSYTGGSFNNTARIVLP